MLCPSAFARGGLSLGTANARSAIPALTNNRTIGNHNANGNRRIVNPRNNGSATTIPFGLQMSGGSGIQGSDKTAAGINGLTKRARGTLF